MPEAQSSTTPYSSTTPLGPRYQLSYIFLAVWLVGYTRTALALLANATRAGARLDRPDQHVYKIMARSGPMKDGPDLGHGMQGMHWHQDASSQ